MEEEMNFSLKVAIHNILSIKEPLFNDSYAEKRCYLAPEQFKKVV
jgi:hypothetical protein